MPAEVPGAGAGAWTLFRPPTPGGEWEPKTSLGRAGARAPARGHPRSAPPRPSPGRPPAPDLTPGRRWRFVPDLRTAPAAHQLGVLGFPSPFPSFKYDKRERGIVDFKNILFDSLIGRQFAPSREVRPGEWPGAGTCPVLPSLCLLPPDAQRWGNGPSWRGCWKPRCSSTPL